MQYFLYSLLWTLIYINCSSQGYEKNPSLVEIHFQEGFENDDVRILIDGREIFFKKLTTDSQSGFAGMCKINCDYTQTYLFIVNNDSLRYGFKPECPFLRVTYSAETNVMIECNQERFLYN